MQARCPYCTHIFTAEKGGVQFCPTCGKQINVPAGPSEPPAGASPPSTGATPPPAGAACPRHPEKAASGTCTRCGTFMCPECSQNGTSAFCPACQPLMGGGVSREPTPWERRGELGLFQALWQTWKLTILSGEKFWPSVRPDGPLSDAFLYGWMMNVIGAALQFPMNLLNLGGMRGQLEQILDKARDLPPVVEQGLQWLMGNTTTLAVMALLGGVLLYPLSFIIGAAFVHLGCLIFGAAKNGFTATARVVGYSSAPVVLAWVPVVGGLLGIYIIVLQVWGIYCVQETTIPRAIGGVLGLVLILACCACIGGIAVAVMVGAGARG
ncbi:MAG: YIP1 family protein [Myxococcota bacterium]